MSGAATSEPRHPGVVVELIGQDGNAYAILGAVRRAMRRAGIPREEYESYFTAATSGDYDHLLRTTMEWVTIE